MREKRIFDKGHTPNRMKYILIILITVFCLKSFGQSSVYISTLNGTFLKSDIVKCNWDSIGVTNITMLDIAQCPDGRLYGTDGPNLYHMNLANASLDSIGSLDSMYFNSLVCDKSGQLFGAGDDNLYKINKSNAHLTLVGNTFFFSEGDLVFYNDTLYESVVDSTATNSFLIRILSTPFSVVQVGRLPNFNFFGLATISDCKNNSQVMYGFSGDSIYTISPYNASTTFVCYDSINPLNVFAGVASIDIGYFPLAIDGNKEPTMPNVFTPNGDGINDYFCMNSVDVSYISLKIYNRWGVLVFETNDRTKGWDGMYEGNSVSDGVYYWILDYKNVCSEESNLKGFVTVSR